MTRSIEKRKKFLSSEERNKKVSEEREEKEIPEFMEDVNHSLGICDDVRWKLNKAHQRNKLRYD